MQSTMTAKRDSSDPELNGRRCDFCGDVVASVRRVALDHEVHDQLALPQVD